MRLMMLRTHRLGTIVCGSARPVRDYGPDIREVAQARASQANPPRGRIVSVRWAAACTLWLLGACRAADQRLAASRSPALYGGLSGDFDQLAQ